MTVTVTVRAMTLRVPHALYLEMQAVARADGVSIAEFVREAVDRWIEGRKSDPIFVQHARQTAAEWQAFANGLGASHSQPETAASLQIDRPTVGEDTSAHGSSN